MAQEAGSRVEHTSVYRERRTWVSGVAAGLAGGAVMGVLLSVLMTPVIEVAIPALVGLSGGLVGWVVHMSISAVFGVVFAALVALTPLADYADRPLALLGVGLAYGAVLWIVAAGIVMPIWLGAVGFPMAPPVPNLNPTSLFVHLTFGAVVGLVYPSS